MNRMKSFSLTSGNLTNLLAGIGEKRRKIKAFYISQSPSSGGIGVGYRFQVYKEQDQIIDFYTDHFGNNDTTADRDYLGMQRKIDVDITLKASDGLQGGLWSGSAYVSGYVTMVYEDLDNTQ